MNEYGPKYITLPINSFRQHHNCFIANECGRIHYDQQKDLYEIKLNDGRECVITGQMLDRFLRKPQGSVVVDGSVQFGELDSRREIGGPGPKELSQ